MLRSGMTGRVVHAAALAAWADHGLAVEIGHHRGDGRVGVDVAQRSDDVADGQITVLPESFHDLPFQCTELHRSKLLGRLVLRAHEADTTWRAAVGSGHDTWPR